MYMSVLIFNHGYNGFHSIMKRGSREDMAAVASPQMATSPSGMTHSDHHTTLMEDPDVWRPT